MKPALLVILIVNALAVQAEAQDGRGEGDMLSRGLAAFQLSCIRAAGEFERCRPDSQHARVLPHVLDPSKVYVFNKKLPGGVSDMGASELPRMLKAAGCSVKSAPRHPRDFLFPDEGEPIFVIRLRCGGQSLELRNRFNRLISEDADLRKTWSVSDLVLKVE